MPTTILVTRPQPDADRFADLLRAGGMTPVLAPMLRIEPTGAAPPDLTGVQGLLFTSANGVRALAAQVADRSLPAFCVGPATADAAREAGFSLLETGGGDVAALTEMVALTLDPAAGVLLHCTGTDRAGNLAGGLESRGFTVRRAVLYRAVWNETLPDAAADALQAGAIDAVTFFSPRTAEAFVSVFGNTTLSGRCSSIVAVCLSAPVADAAKGLTWRAVRVAAEPNASALLTQLRGIDAGP